MAMTESQKKYEKKRMQSCKSYTIKYTVQIHSQKKQQSKIQIAFIIVKISKDV